MYRILAGLLAIFLMVGASSAQSIPGADAPPFKQAVTLWLADNDRDALPLLSSLAKTGNPAARVLIALIDKTPELQGPWLGALPRAERIALLRQARGISGQSWMKALDGVSLADAWLTLWDVDATLDTALTFAELGEARAARQALVFLAARERSGFAKAADDPRYPASMRFLIWQEWAKDPASTVHLAAELAAAERGDPQRVIMGQGVENSALESWLLRNEVARPLASFCNSVCPDSVGTCARAGFAGLTGYRRLVMAGTPAAALIDEDIFSSSPRGRATLLRRVLLATSDPARQIASLGEVDACFARALQSELEKR